MILANGPTIARLCGHTRKWAHAGIQSGWFGLVMRLLKTIARSRGIRSLAYLSL